ncbi:MAG: hypothetical protein K9L56_15695 [Clostridiales bacterium]|nr:hypothetical protein [Clostridiales bacterium]
MRKVNRGLRFNPKSTELLSQKQDLLKKRISKTSDKLDTLRKSQKQVKKQFKNGEIDEGQYRAFKREIVQTESKMDTFNSQLGKTNKRARKAKLGLGDLKKASRMLATGVAAVGTALVATGYVMGREINKTMDYADEIDKLSQKMGLTAEATQEWTFVAEQNGTNIESLTRALGRFQKNVGDADDGLTTATRSFNHLEVGIYDVNENLKDMDDIFPETIRKLSEMEDETKRNQIAMNLFGRGGKELIPILNQNTEEIDGLIQKANDLDLVMKDEDIKSWVDFKDATHEVTEEFNALRRELSTDLLPFLESEFLPFIQNDLNPALKNAWDFISKGFGFSFAYDEDGSAEQAIRDIESLSEAEQTLQEKRKELAETPEFKDLGFLEFYGMSKEERQSHLERREMLESEIALLEYRVKNWDKLNQKEDNDDNGGDGEDSSGTPSWLYDENGTAPEISYDGLSEEETRKIAQEIMDLGYEKEIMQLEGIEKELLQNRLSERQALRGVEDGTLRESIEQNYKVRRQLIYDKYGEEEKKLEKQLQNELALLKKEGLEKELEQLQQQKNIELQEVGDNAKAKNAVIEKYKIKEQELREKYAQKEIKLEDELTNNKFAINQISLSEYKSYLQERLNDYEKYTDEWLKLKQKIDDLEVTPGEVESEYESGLEQLKQRNETFGDSFDFVAEKTKLVKDTVDRLIETGNTDSELFAELSNLYNEMNSSDGGEAESLNWMTDAFVDMGVEIETANQKFNDWKDDMVDGLSNAIARGEDFGDVLENIGDQIAAMVIKQAIVQPIVNQILPTAHDGAYVSPKGLIQDLPKYHSGGNVTGLKNDEVPAVLQTGERVLSRKQNKAFEAGVAGGDTYQVTINAVDSQSFAQAIQRNPEAIVSVVSQDIMRNGTTRKAIKKS